MFRSLHSGQAYVFQVRIIMYNLPSNFVSFFMLVKEVKINTQIIVA